MPFPLETSIDTLKGMVVLASGHTDADRGLRIGFRDEVFPRIAIHPTGDIFTGDGTVEPATPFTGGGGGAVSSVNGHTGAVVLGAADVGADASGAAAAAQAASQPVDSDLTAIAALSTTAFGRSFLALLDAAAGRTLLGLGTAATQASTAFDAAGAAAAAQSASQPVDSDLTAIAALTTTTFGRSLLTQADAAATRSTLGLGTAAVVNTGTASGDLPLLSTGGVLPMARLATGTPDGTKFIRDDGTLAVPAGGGGGSSRTTVTITTASLADGASETSTVTMGKSYRLLNISTDRACRTELYTTAAKRTADASRAIGTDPTGDHGVELDFVSTATVLAADLSPEVDGSNMEATPSSAIPYRITNSSGSTHTVAVTLTYIVTET